MPHEPRPMTRPVRHGLIAVGSHVGLTTRQLDQLRADGQILELELTCHAAGAEHPRSARQRDRRRGGAPAAGQRLRQ